MESKERLKKAFHEIYHKVPRTVKKSGLKGEKRRKMMIAIAFSKSKQK